MGYEMKEEQSCPARCSNVLFKPATDCYSTLLTLLQITDLFQSWMKGNGSGNGWHGMEWSGVKWSEVEWNAVGWSGTYGMAWDDKYQV